MVEQEIIDNEKLIANFMKEKNVFPFICKDGDFLGMYIADEEDGTIDYSDGIKWINYKSWKNIMPVIENIESIFETPNHKESVDITSHHVKYSHFNGVNCDFSIIVGCYLESPEEIKVSSKLEAVYLVASEFIKWYDKKYNK